MVDKPHMDSSRERGVSMLEMAMFIPMLVLLCFGVVDLLRFMYLETLLNRAAADIAITAKTIPNLDYDLRELTINNLEYYDFYQARNLALQPGITFALNSFTQPGTPSGAELLASSQIDDALGNYTTPTASLTPVSSSALILRPGEQGTFVYTPTGGSSVTNTILHPLLQPDFVGHLPPARMDNLMEMVPIHVEIRAKVRPLLMPLLGEKILRGIATTYRERGLRRVAMAAPAGVPIPAAGTRRSSSDEQWTQAPEPMEPVSPVLNWFLAFQRSLTSQSSRCPAPSGINPPPCKQQI